jgi:hypothetical protein
MRELRFEEALARIEPASRSSLELCSLALADNLSHRTLTPLECAKALSILHDLCGLSETVLVEQYLPLLGLPAHVNMLRSYLKLNCLVLGLRDKFRLGWLTLASVERLTVMPEAVQYQFSEFFAQARFSASLQKQVLELLEELGALAGGGINEVLALPELVAVLHDEALSQYQRGGKVHEVLYRRRHPRISRAYDEFNDKRQRLALPGTVQLAPDPFFEKGRIKVNFEFSSAEEFQAVASVIASAAEKKAVLDSLFDVH